MSIDVTIDGRQVSVEPGSTILDAARALGIEIPTMCHVDGLEPWTSCFLCVVRVAGRRNLLPACSARVEAGMDITTDSEEIRAARRTALELLLSDHRGDCIAPCSLACPAGLDVPGFISLMLAGRMRESIALIKERIPFPGVLGRVCPRYCERVCRRSESEEAIAICALKRYVADADLACEDPYVPAIAAGTGKNVGVVGAGPAGLSAAFYLMKAGHACTVYDEREDPGGMMRYGVPSFRLPRDVICGEVEVLRGMGCAFQMGTRIGDAEALDALRRKHDAVLLAMGAGRAPTVDVQGVAFCTSALDFLGMAPERQPEIVGDSVVVIGGGNEAVACARTAAALGARVSIIWEGERRRMSCFGELLDKAEAEDVTVHTSTCVERIEQVDAELRLTCAGEAGEVTLECSLAIAAPEREVDFAALDAWDLRVSSRGIDADRQTLSTSVTGVFAAGDVISGPGSIVRAVAAGRLASISISQFLHGETPTGEPRPFNVRMGRLSEEDRAQLLQEIDHSPRILQTESRPGYAHGAFAETVRGYTDAQAMDEGARCLQCDCLARDNCRLRDYAAEYDADPNRFRSKPRPFLRDTSAGVVVFEPSKCILCGRCVRIAEAHGEKLGIGFRQRGFGTHLAVPFEGKLSKGLEKTLRLCAEACPTGALGLRVRNQSGSRGRVSTKASSPCE